ncbi:MAG TPA: hypothetical protein VMF90_18515 [Rhizobiaceae bacterium]|nr:hypothetical protein [Rhizobiaceae bacterium]
MTRRRIMAVLALLAFAVFLAVVIFKLKRVDLAVAALIGLGLATYDVWSQLRPRRLR